jgi:hypothetical protein
LKQVTRIGLLTLALVAAFGLIAARTGGVPRAAAQADDAERCSTPAGGYTPGATFTCTQGLGVGGAAVEVSLVGQNGFLLTSISVTPGSNTGCPTTSVITIQAGLDFILGCNTQTAGNFFTSVTENFLVTPNGFDGEQLEKDVTCFSVWAPGTSHSPAALAPANSDLTAAGAALSSLADAAPNHGDTQSGLVVTGGVFLSGQGGSCGLNGVTAIQGGTTEFPTGLSDQTVQEFSKGVCNGTLGLVTYGGNCSGIGTNTPTGEVKTCTNTVLGGVLSQTGIGVQPNNLGVTSNATSFTLPLFGPASTCVIILQGPTVRGVPGNGPFTDGFITVTLSNTNGAGAVLSCASLATPTGQTLPTVSNGGTACQQQSPTTLILPCGSTAGVTNTANTNSTTCTGVTFDIESAIAACVSNVITQACVNPSFSGLNLNGGGTVTLTVAYAPTPINAFSNFASSTILGTNSFTFGGVGIGTLIVQATPQLIPSNGTEASVVTAQFACTEGFNTVSGFPFSNTTSTPLNISANGTITVTQGCGASLPGTFTFATPGPVLFDNGRSTESVTCGPNGNVNAFGNGANPFFAPLGSTYPLVFTCTGAAVLAIGAGAAGDAPINVTYQSAIGGLQAVGSTLITVSPSGIPRISVACNPSTISAGNTGSLCTATVTDINGVPLSGITGATVTFTTSDPSTTTILPCTIGTPGAINVTTSPSVIPLITPQTPCVTPSSVIPGQVNTFVNGQATALLVASSTAHPEVVTVTAALGVLIPPEFACLVAPYASAGFGGIPATPGYYAPTSAYGIYGCGTTQPIGLTGLSTALNVAGGGLTGIVTLPNTTSASTTVVVGGPAGIQIAGATAVSPLVLSRGCNNVIVTSTVGTPIANIAALVTPQNAVVSIWRFSNSTKLFQAGFFSDPNAPTDFTLTGYLTGTVAPNSSSTIISAPSYSYAYNPASPTTAIAATGLTVTGNQITESYYVCVNQQATMISG